MGCDIHGGIEAHQPDGWTRYLSPLSGFVGRNYRAFGCLFGVRNSAQFDPLFADRGFPDSMSWRLRKDIEGWGADPDDPTERVDFHSPSYVTLEELQAVDWNEEAEGPSTHYVVLDHNKERTGHGFGWSSAFAEFIENHQQALASGKPVPFDGEVNDSGLLTPADATYIQRRVFTRHEAIEGAWEWLIEELMPLYAERFDSHEIRLVVWFDN